MNQLSERALGLHVPIVGWLTIAADALVLLVGICGFVLLVGIGLIPAAQGDPTGLLVLSIIGIVGLLFFAALALPGMLAGFGLLKRQRWGQILAIVVAFLGLFSFPIGTAIGTYTLWVLLQNSASAYFSGAEAVE